LKQEQFVPRFFTIRLVTVLLGLLTSERCMLAQPATDFTIINDRMSFGPALLDKTNAYCYWPRSVVTEPAISAIELATGQHLWTIPAKLASPVYFCIDEGWIHFETTESDQIMYRRSTGPRTFHLVNALTGEDRAYPTPQETRSNVEGTWVRHNRCLTNSGLLVQCSDGKTVGTLGEGEHQAIVNESEFLVTTLIPDSSNIRFQKRLLRKFDLETGRLKHEIELPLEVPWRVVAAKGEIVVGRTELGDRTPQLVCLNLADQTELWRVSIPFSVRMSPVHWDEDRSHLELTMGIHGLVRPLRVDLESGQLLPDNTWQDPRLLLSWYQEAAQYPDFVAENKNFIVGRWRFIQLACIERETGNLVWNQGNSDFLISRVFSAEPEMGEYVVTESRRGFDLIEVATGNRKTISIDQVGLSAKEVEPALTNETVGAVATLDEDAPDVWLWNQGFLFGPLIPFAGWIVWSMTRR
jgi:hypothetical protein